MPSLNRNQQKLIQNKLQRAVYDAQHAAEEVNHIRYRQQVEALQVNTELTATYNAAMAKIRKYAKRTLDPVLEEIRASGSVVKYKAAGGNDYWEASEHYTVRSNNIVTNAVHGEELKALTQVYDARKQEIWKQSREGTRKIEDIMFALVVSDGPILDSINACIEELKAVFKEA